jgi:hypothetical protein
MATLWSATALGQTFWPKNTPKLPMTKQWVAIKAKLPPYSPPRTPDGVPDFQGMWGGAGGDGMPNVEGSDIMLDNTTAAQESSILDPPDQKVPYRPWARAKFLEHLKGIGRGWPSDEVPKGHPRSHVHARQICIPAEPRTMVDGGQEIVQKPGLFIILSDDDWYRMIPTDGRPRVGQNSRSWQGNPRGRWEGDTLVVEFTNNNGLGWLDYSGNFFTENVRLVERWTLADRNTIDYELTIDDPSAFAQPWKINFPKRRAGSGPVGIAAPPSVPGAMSGIPVVKDAHADEVWEEACFEGNHQNLLGIHDIGFRWFRGARPPN